MTDQEQCEASIKEELAKIEHLLIQKNRAYGNSAIDPVRIFSQASPVEQILVRIDDKLSRIQRGRVSSDAIVAEDTIGDLIGYLVLLRVAYRGL